MKDLLAEISYIAIDTRSSAVTTASFNEAASNMSVTSLSGVLRDSKRSWSLKHSDAVPEACTVLDIADSPGEWSALATVRQDHYRKFLYFGDPSGFAPVFYSLLPGRALVLSDTFSGVVQGVQRLGGKLSLNVENYLTLISGKSTTFRNLISNQTMAEEINILGHDKALAVDHENASIFERSQLSKAQQISSYESALDIGIATAGESIKRVITANHDATRAITLTGGADSRMAFAILLTTGLANEFDLWTIDPRLRKSPRQKEVFTADVEIANELRAFYNLNWMKPVPREKISVSFEESLAYHQSYGSNFAFTYKPSKALAFNAEPLVSLRGGGGEILRGSGGARIAELRYNKYRSEGGMQTSIEWMADEYIRGSLMTTATKDIARGHLERTLGNYEAETLRQTIDAFYRGTRNRGHFGHARKSAMANDDIMLALTNPYLLRAMELIDLSEKTSGKLVIDLLDKTEPELRRFPFENPSTNEQLMKAPQKIFDFEQRDGWMTAFDSNEARSAPTEFRNLWGPGSRGENWQFTIAEKDFAFVSAGFGRVLDVVPIHSRSIVSAQHEMTLQHLHDGTVPVGSVSAKVASALDVFAPMSLDRPGSHFFTNPEGDRRIPSSSGIANKASAYVLTLE